MFRAKKSALIAASVLIFVAGLWLFLRAIYYPPILMYHSVNPPAGYNMPMLTVSPRTFEKQMRFLREHNYNVITLEALANLIKEKKSIPPKTLTITLDDGYRDNYIHAFPILKKYQMPAAIFVIINEVGRRQGDRLSWEEIKEMQDSGLITFGSHALGPEPLVNIKSDSVVKSQIFDSKKILEAKLARPVNCFSYPEGLLNMRIRRLVQEAGYKVAVSTRPGKQYHGNDIFVLRRLRISEKAGNLFIFWFESSGYYTFFKQRKHR